MELLPEEYSAMLHESSLHPYTQHLERRDNEWYNEIITIATNNNHFFDYLHCISDRGRKNRFEFFAECFANSQLGDPNELGAAMTEGLSQRGL